jgi:hypothetical protein
MTKLLIAATVLIAVIANAKPPKDKNISPLPVGTKVHVETTVCLYGANEYTKLWNTSITDLQKMVDFGDFHVYKVMNDTKGIVTKEQEEFDGYLTKARVVA